MDYGDPQQIWQRINNFDGTVSFGNANNMFITCPQRPSSSSPNIYMAPRNNAITQRLIVQYNPNGYYEIMCSENKNVSFEARSASENS